MEQDTMFRWHDRARLFARDSEVPHVPSRHTGGFKPIRALPTHQALTDLARAIAANTSFCVAEKALPADVQAEPPHFLTLTGGSTGAPKLIRRTQASWIASFEVNATLFALSPDRSVATLGQLSHSLALYAVLEGLHLGLDVHVLEGLKPYRQRELLRGRAVDVLYATPTQLRLLAHGAKEDTLGDLRTILCGGGALDTATETRVRRLCPNADLRVFYGSAETSFVTISDADTPVGSVGRAYPGVDLRLLDGAVWVRSPYLFDSYAQGGSTETRWHDGRLSVGEFGRMDAAGNLFLTGRRGRMVQVSDQNVFPEVIEALVSETLGGTLCAALPQPDPKRGHHIVLVLQGIERADVARQATDVCKDKLGPAATPRRVVFRDTLPLLASGKVDLPSLATWLEDRP